MEWETNKEDYSKTATAWDGERVTVARVYDGEERMFWTRIRQCLDGTIHVAPDLCLSEAEAITRAERIADVGKPAQAQ